MAGDNKYKNKRQWNLHKRKEVKDAEGQGAWLLEVILQEETVQLHTLS